MGLSLSCEPNIVEGIIESYSNRFNRWHQNGSAYCTERQPTSHHGWNEDVVIGSELQCENRSGMFRPRPT